jgi:hypothetical protein
MAWICPMCPPEVNPDLKQLSDEDYEVHRLIHERELSDVDKKSDDGRLVYVAPMAEYLENSFIAEWTVNLVSTK